MRWKIWDYDGDGHEEGWGGDGRMLGGWVGRIMIMVVLYDAVAEWMLESM